MVVRLSISPSAPAHTYQRAVLWLFKLPFLNLVFLLQRQSIKMRLSSILLGLLPAVGVLADPFAAANHKTCKNGPVSLYGRQCQRYCGYEFTSGSYKNDYQSCFNDCAAACAKDQQCNSAKWSTSSKKCYYNKNKSPYWQKTGRGHAVKCDKKPKPKTTTTKRTTTISTTKSTV